MRLEWVVSELSAIRSTKELTVVCTYSPLGGVCHRSRFRPTMGCRAGPLPADRAL